MQTSQYQILLTDFHSTRLAPVGCRQHLLANGIQELTLGSASQNTVSEWVRCLDIVVRQASPRRPLRVLTDARRSVLPPLAYVSYLAELIMLYPFAIPGGRSAVLHEAGPLTPDAQAVADSLMCGSDQIRFFAPHQREEALRWLAG